MDLKTGVERYVPGVRAARSYQKRWARPDAVAGLVLAAILVPQGMAYAELAGLPAVTGLYTTIACLVGYAIFGPSRVLVLGPDSSVSPLIFAAIAPLFVAGDMEAAIALAGMLAILVGLVEVGLGAFKLGFVADLLSSEVQVGYMNGLAVTIIVGQLPKLFGFSTDSDTFWDDIHEFFTHLDETKAAALAIGVGVLVVLLVLPRVSRRIPAVLVAVAAATIVSAIAGLSSEIATVGTLPQGVPTPSLPWTQLSDVGPLLLAAMGIVLVSLTDTIATASAFAARRGDELEPNQEMIGIGASNIAAGFFQGFAVSTSGSRTAVAFKAGARSQITGLVGAVAILILLVVAPNLLAALPIPVLGAIVVVAAFSLAEIPATRRLWSQRRMEFWLSIAATLAVAVLGVLPGIGVAVALSILNVFRRSWWPYQAVLGREKGTNPGYFDLAENPRAGSMPGLTIFRFDAPIFFANARTFADQVLRLADADPKPNWILVAAEPISDIDTTAADMLEELAGDLETRGVQLAFAELKEPVRAKIDGYGMHHVLEKFHYFSTLNKAGKAYQEKYGTLWPGEEPPAAAAAPATAAAPAPAPAAIDEPER